MTRLQNKREETHMHLKAAFQSTANERMKRHIAVLLGTVVYREDGQG